MIPTILTHRGAKFSAHGRAGLFLKDLMHDGTWVHPITNQVIKVTPEIRQSVQVNMAQWLVNGNKVPMPDGHVIETAANRGFWPGPFTSIGDDVLAVAEPLDADTKQQMANGTADAVSVSWWSKLTDVNKISYENVFDHVCLTNYPVITKQRNFVALSFFDATAAAEMIKLCAAPEEDEALLRGMEKVYQALRQGAQREIDGIMRTPAERLAALLAKCPLK